jgi:FXSXX-COOH protein
MDDAQVPDTREIPLVRLAQQQAPADQELLRRIAPGAGRVHTAAFQSSI